MAEKRRVLGQKLSMQPTALPTPHTALPVQSWTWVSVKIKGRDHYQFNIMNI